MGSRDYFHIECWMQVGCIYKCPWVWDLKKKKEGTEAVYQDSGVYHHAVSYCDIGHISADFRNDAYDFMARDKLDVKCWDIPPSSIRRISLEKRRKNSQETWLGTRPKNKNKKIPNQSFFLLLSAQGNCTNQPRRHGDRCHRLQYRWLFKSRVDVHFINSIPDTDVRGDVFFFTFYENLIRGCQLWNIGVYDF